MFESVQPKVAKTVFHAYAMVVWGELRRTGVKGVSVIAEEIWDLTALHRARARGQLREAMEARTAAHGSRAQALAREPRFRGMMTPDDRSARRTDPARRPRRLLRLRRGAEGPEPQGQAGHRGRGRAARGRRQRLLRGARLRRALGDARSPRAAPLPGGDLPARRTSRPTACTRTASARCCSPTPRWWSRSRWTRPSWMWAAPPRLFGSPDRDRGEDPSRGRVGGGRHCSVGVAPTKFVAKLASDECKPDGLLVRARPTASRAFLEPLPVGRLWGVGEKTARDPGPHGGSGPSGTWAARPMTILERLLGVQNAHAPLRARPRHRRPRGRPLRGPEVGGSRGDVRARPGRRRGDPARAPRALGPRGDPAARRRLPARTVTLKVRLATFTTLTRSRTLPDATDVGADLYRTVGGALPGAAGGAPPAIRLLGVQAHRPRGGRRRAARAAARRALGRRRAHRRPDRAAVRAGRGDAGLAPGSRPPTLSGSSIASDLSDASL